MELKLKSITIEGFGSIHDSMEFCLDKPGFNIIQAKNGVGKSTILAAICWVFWAKALKSKATSVSTWEYLRTSKYKGTMVSIDFLVDGIPYKVIRCKDYRGIVKEINAKGSSSLIIIKEGIVQDQLRDKADVKSEVSKIIGYSFDLFKNSVIFGQKVSRIISESSPKQKEILEQAFEVGYINKAHELEKAELTIIRKEYVEELMVLNRDEAKMDSLKKIIALMREQKASFETHKLEKLAMYAKQIDGLNEQLRNKQRDILAAKGAKSNIQALESKLAIYDNAKKEYKLLENQEFRIANTIGTLENQAEVMLKKQEAIRNSINQDMTVCDACGSVLNEKGAKAQRERYKAEYNNLKKDYLTKTIEIGENLKIQKALLTEMGYQSDKFSDAGQYQKQLDKLRMNYRPLTELKTDMGAIEEEIKEVLGVSNLVRAENNPTKIKPKIKEKMALLESIKTQKLRVKKLKKKVDIKEWLINDALSNKGLKAYIFQSMLGAINKRLANYARYIGFKANISIDMKSAHKNIQIKVYAGEHEVNVGDLSGGQCQLVDIAISFSIHDVVSKDKGCNLLFMDEVFESLDAENVELVTELIQSKAKGLTLFLITHLSTFNVTGSNIIRLKQNKNKHTVFAE